MIIDIRTMDLPSRGWKSGLPETFEMEKFCGRHTMAIARSAHEDDMTELLTKILPDCLSVPIDNISIGDAHYLLFLQRMSNAEMPLVTRWNCNKPLFQYSRGVFNTIQDDTPPLETFPCNTLNQSVIDATSLAMVELQAADTEFDLARMRHYEQTLGENAMFYYHAAHMGPDMDKNISVLEQQPDMVLWLKLAKWVANARHGLSTEISVTCNCCHRDSNRSWDLRPKVFINA